MEEMETLLVSGETYSNDDFKKSIRDGAFGPLDALTDPFTEVREIDGTTYARLRYDAIRMTRFKNVTLIEFMWQGRPTGHMKFNEVLRVGERLTITSLEGTRPVTISFA